MRDTAKNMFYLGLGAFSLTREKAREAVNELVNRGAIEKNEATSLVESIIEKGNKQRQEIKNIISLEIAKTAEELNLAQASKVVALEARIKALEERLSNLEKGEPPTPGQ